MYVSNPEAKNTYFFDNVSKKKKTYILNWMFTINYLDCICR